MTTGTRGTVSVFAATFGAALFAFLAATGFGRAAELTAHEKQLAAAVMRCLALVLLALAAFMGGHVDACVHAAITS